MKQLNGLTVGTILLLEDEPFIALDLEEILSEAGFTQIRTIVSCAEAESWLQEGDPMLAIVDPRLQDGMCSGVVRTLVERKVPFIVYSGDVETVSEQEPAFAFGIWLSKPSPPGDIIQAIKTTLLGRL
ncbi:response regulator (plasmid) [Rhizobium lusitanum]|uniref:response regulator n=1 Tax=Rhizobium lusitanum TaxID=293958 RepID=UPI00160DC3C5|nr:response regulator [Rhizobium lusitanum]QND46058.1 response regulator [Rhizobium lusitanum]